jgi:hypothetical protein
MKSLFLSILSMWHGDLFGYLVDPLGKCVLDSPRVSGILYQNTGPWTRPSQVQARILGHVPNPWPLTTLKQKAKSSLSFWDMSPALGP